MISEYERGRILKLLRWCYYEGWSRGKFEDKNYDHEKQCEKYINFIIEDLLEEA